MKNKTKIVIVGGGFGGIYTARNLDKIFECEDVEVTLINKTNYFLFTPLLHEVATGGLTPDSIVEPVREIFRGGCVNFVEDVVTEIDRVNKKVTSSQNTFDYDYLVVSAGAETNYYGTPGAVENTFTLKNLEDAITIRNHIIDICEQAVSTKNKDLLTVAIVGAGATGVELACETVEYMQHTICSYYSDSGFSKDDIKVILVTATPDVLSQFPEKMRDVAQKELEKRGIKVLTNMCVEKVEPKTLICTKGDDASVKANTIVWVAGVTPVLKDIKGTEAGPKGRMEVNKHLQSVINPEVFGIGDASGTFPMLAQVAVKQAKVVAQNIYALVNGSKELKTFEFKQDILLISLGKWYASGYFWGYTLRGRLMWLLWRLVYLFNFISWRKKLEIITEWTINFFYPRDITRIK